MDITIDTDAYNEIEKQIAEKQVAEQSQKRAGRKPAQKAQQESVSNTPEEPINCLRKERVIVRFLPKQGGIWGDNPKHILSGGMSENASLVLVVPRLKSGAYVNVLTNNEKAYLERVMGLEHNALSIHRRDNNFWDDSNPEGINKVRLTKQNNYFDLSDPGDYIRYKILLANKDIIAPSLQALTDLPKATYKFVIVSETDENRQIKKSVNVAMECYKEFGRVMDDKDTLKYIIEMIEGRPIASNVKLEILQGQIDKLIRNDAKRFLNVITDEARDIKVMIRKCVEVGIIAKRGDYYYITKNNMPLCNANQNPTLSSAAEYLGNIKNQDIKFNLETELAQRTNK